MSYDLVYFYKNQQLMPIIHLRNYFIFRLSVATIGFWPQKNEVQLIHELRFFVLNDWIFIFLNSNKRAIRVM